MSLVKLGHTTEMRRKFKRNRNVIRVDFSKESNYNVKSSDQIYNELEFLHNKLRMHFILRHWSAQNYLRLSELDRNLHYFTVK